MEKYAAVLIGGGDSAELFDSKTEADAFAIKENAGFRAEYPDDDAYRNDGNAPEYVVMTESDARRDYPWKLE